MKNYNADTIVDITTLDSVESERYKYKTEKRLFGIRIRKEGIYSSCSGYRYDVNECPEGYKLVNGVVYTKPECRINFVDRSSVSFYFNNYKEAVSYKHEIISKGNYI